MYNTKILNGYPWNASSVFCLIAYGQCPFETEIRLFIAFPETAIMFDESGHTM